MAPGILTHLPVELLAPVERAFPGIEIARVPEEGPAPRGTRAEVLLTTALGTPNLPELVKGGVRWIHTIGTGVDRFPLHAVGNAILTCSRGGSAIPIAESSCVCPVGFVEGPGSTRDDLLSVPAWLRRST